MKKTENVVILHQIIDIEVPRLAIVCSYLFRIMILCYSEGWAVLELSSQPIPTWGNSAPTSHAKAGTITWKNPVPCGTPTHDLKIVWQIFYRLSNGGMWSCGACLQSFAEMLPRGLQPIKMLHCRPILKPNSSQLSRQTAQDPNQVEN